MGTTDRIGDLPPPYREVVFDCDSTLSTIEGIDELAGGLAAELAELTDRAMSGELPLEAIFGARLERVRPTRAGVEALGQRYVETLLPGARELFAALGAAGVGVRIVSGGLALAVRHVGRELGLAAERVHAVELDFDEHGNYAGFDATTPLACAGGKPRLLNALGLARPAALVGDGATDLEAAVAGAVDRFVAFGGVVARDAVHSAAAVRSNATDLRGLAPLLLSEAQREALASGPHAWAGR
ncbi:HAD-IB family phosphatase [Engelhardtia mirabilis]|uniref:phosphoserine phosphatase n=1 Tax=Engelhardtia mirabilis TaxID=2528011 RepID=A0A518BLW7_9BACT|nr:Phosphoserine phosphatase [Planctomycetes bacterium Pla133]QDV02296.1 Phosphoserine phosphatase [Planctomycetes bacterium Pla86]